MTDHPAATRYLLDHMLRSPPHISAVVRHAGARYVAGVRVRVRVRVRLGLGLGLG